MLPPLCNGCGSHPHTQINQARDLRGPDSYFGCGVGPTYHHTCPRRPATKNDHSEQLQNCKVCDACVSTALWRCHKHDATCYLTCTMDVGPTPHPNTHTPTHFSPGLRGLIPSSQSRRSASRSATPRRPVRPAGRGTTTLYAWTAGVRPGASCPDPCTVSTLR